MSSDPRSPLLSLQRNTNDIRRERRSASTSAPRKRVARKLAVPATAFSATTYDPVKVGSLSPRGCPAAERRCATGRSSKDEDTSAPAARDLIESGYEPERVAALRGGLFACNEEGYPVKWYDQ